MPKVTFNEEYLDKRVKFYAEQGTQMPGSEGAKILTETYRSRYGYRLFDAGMRSAAFARDMHIQIGDLVPADMLAESVWETLKRQLPTIGFTSSEIEKILDILAGALKISAVSEGCFLALDIYSADPITGKRASSPILIVPR